MQKIVAFPFIVILGLAFLLLKPIVWLAEGMDKLVMGE